MMQMPMGQYRPGNTFFHRADAKGKLLGLCLVIAAVIVSKGLIGCIAAAAAALTVSYLAGISLREQVKQQKGMCRFLAVIFLMNAFFYSGEHCIWSWWIFRLSREGIRQGAMVVVHLVLILVFCMVLTITTEPMEITHGLEELLSPLSKVGVPTEEIAMILGVAMQFIPVLGEEACADAGAGEGGWNAGSRRDSGVSGTFDAFCRWSYRCFWRRFVGRMNWRAQWRREVIAGRGGEQRRKNHCQTATGMWQLPRVRFF